MSAGRDDVANEELQQTAAASHAAELSADTRSALEARYELRQLLGRGSSAVVFLALDRVRDARLEHHCVGRIESQALAVGDDSACTTN